MSLKTRAKALASPRGGEVAISQENDLITFVNSGVVSHWAREGALTSTAFSFTIAFKFTLWLKCGGFCDEEVLAHILLSGSQCDASLERNPQERMDMCQQDVNKIHNKELYCSPNLTRSAIHQFYSVKVNKRAGWTTFNLSTLCYFLFIYLFFWPRVSFSGPKSLFAF